MVEAGYPEIEGEGWFAFIVPAGTPKEITALLNREIVKMIALPDVKEHWRRSALSRSAPRRSELRRAVSDGEQQMGEGHPRGRHQGQLTAPHAGGRKLLV